MAVNDKPIFDYPDSFSASTNTIELFREIQ